MAGRPLPIHTFFSFVVDPDLGRSRLSHAADDSDAVVVAKAEAKADVPGALEVLLERGSHDQQWWDTNAQGGEGGREGQRERERWREGERERDRLRKI